MVKKLFALASVTALTGLVSAVAAAGCSSTTEETTTGDSGGGDAKADTGKKDGSSSGDPEEDAATCKKAGASFTPPTINPPAASQNLAACSDGVLDALADACSKEPEGAGCKTARELAANSACADCIFGAKTDANWKMIILQPGETPAARYNQSGCIDLAGGVPDCGKKYFTVVSCFDTFCSDCTGAEEQACQKDVASGSGECKTYLIDQACGNALDTVEKTCFPGEQTDAAIKTLFVNMAKAFCAKGAATDGG
jgi:hypothetical protein